MQVDDHLTHIDPSVLSGAFVYGTIGGSIGVGLGLYHLHIGGNGMTFAPPSQLGASGTGGGLGAGFGAGASVISGTATIIDVNWECCN